MPSSQWSPHLETQPVSLLQMDHLTERNSTLLRRVAEAEGANAAVKGQIQEFYQKLRIVQVDNSLLQQQTAVCQKQQQTALCQKQQEKVSIPVSLCSCKGMISGLNGMMSAEPFHDTGCMWRNIAFAVNSWLTKSWPIYR